jgi:hypothetical protein
MEPFAESAPATHVVFEPIMATIQLAWLFTEVDRSDLSEFVGRWLGHFGDAATAALERPLQMPRTKINIEINTSKMVLASRQTHTEPVGTQWFMRRHPN